MAHDEVDAVVVGVGAAGGVLIRKLADAGWRVLGLDVGPHWDPQSDFRSDESAMTKLFWRDRCVSTGDDPIELAGNVTGKGIGGSTTHYSIYALRLHRSDFETATRDGVESDWPLSYDDLEPYYDEVERELGITGPVDWPWDAPRKGAYPYRPHQLNGVGEVMARGCDALGITWRPGAIATPSAPKGDRPPCVHRGWCLSGCTTNATSSTLVTYAKEAVRAGAEIRPDCMVHRIDTDASGRATGVTYFRRDADGNVHEEQQPAAHLMGACRMGDDPAGSVVDRDCRSWDVPGLYVCDGSVFVTSGASNPSLTIQAIAARTADQLVAAGRRGEL
jgi:choline dehydrogenase-like flavoprotein